MRLLFVNPYIYDFTAYDLWLRPLGLLYIAAVVEKYTNCEIYWLDALDRFQPGAGVKPGASGRGKYHREIVDKPSIYSKTPRNYARYGMPYAAFQEKLERLPEIDMILVATLMTYWIDGLSFTLNALTQRFPRAQIVIGGTLPTLIAHDLIAANLSTPNGAIRFIAGYGEKQILQLIEQSGGRIYAHPDFSEIDNIPYPAFELTAERSVLPLLTSRGCPYRCTYCASNLLNERFLERDPEKILAEIEYMHEQYGARQFVIFDDALLVDRRNRFMKVFTRVKEKLSLSFHTPNGLHPGEIDSETAELLFQSGFNTLRLSFESIKEDILARSSHKVTVRQMEAAVENLEKAGYKRSEIGVYLLTGYPGQSIEDFERSLFFVGDIGVQPHLALFSPVPGTVDFNELQREGILAAPTNLYETNKIYFLYNKSQFTHEQIQYIKELSINVSRKQVFSS